MNVELRMQNEESRWLLNWLLLFMLLSSFFIQPLLAEDSPREVFNAGTKQLRAGMLKDAEETLQRAVASQDDRVQAAALYNLGLVRVAQGAEILKKAPAASPTARHAELMADLGDEVGQRVEDAMANQDVGQMLAAYSRGRGVRREMRAAIKAIKQALEKYGTALAKWQRAAGDFKSAAELHPDANAKSNADATDRAIAALIDKINQLQQAGAKLAGAKGKLGQQLMKMKGQIPAPNMPPGAPGGSEEDDEDDDEPFGKKPGQQEGEPRMGNETKLSREEAGQLLNGFKLGGDRHLPMGTDEKAAPKKPTGRNW